MRRKYKFNIDIFTDEKNISYYLLGAFITDGSVISDGKTMRVSLASKDKDWLELINQYISPDMPIGKGGSCPKLYYTSIELAQWLINHGCVQRKSLIVQMPYIPEEYMTDFIRGCWDGDGSISFTRRYREDRNVFEKCRRAKITSGSLAFTQGIFDYLIKIGINATIQSYMPRPALYKVENRIIQSKNIYYEIHLSSGKDIYNFCNNIYYKNSCLVMSRKQVIADTLVKDWERETICVICSKPIHKDNSRRIQKYCDTCYKIRVREKVKGK